MALTLVTAPTTEPLTLKQAKAYLNLDVDDDDVLVNALIKAARGHVEAFTGRKLITQTWDDKRRDFPCVDRLVLPFAPVSSVTSVTYVAADGTSTVWSSANYTTSLPSGPQASPGVIEPVYGVSWPTTRDVINAVTVRFVCGYGASGSTVPDGMLLAMRYLITHWYENRSPVRVGNIVTAVPNTVDALLSPFKLHAHEAYA